MCSFWHLRMRHTCNDFLNSLLHPLSNLVDIHYYFPGFPRLRISFELIIAFLDEKQVLLLILKYCRHVNICFHWLSQLVFKVDNISFGCISYFYCISSLKPLLDFLVFSLTAICRLKQRFGKTSY